MAANIVSKANESSFLLPDLTGLSDEERSQLLVVMKKAQEFEVSEEKQLMRQPLEGLLYKYTNVMKGWQYRWFVLNPDAGRLEYYEKEEHKKVMRPRGCLALANATVCPSDEDSQTFYVNACNGESFRLKAFDAKERQHWVNRLRATAEYHSEISGGNNIISGLLGQSTTSVSSQRQQVSHSNTAASVPARHTELTDGLFHGPTSLFTARSGRPTGVHGSMKAAVAPPSIDSDGHIDASLKTCIDSLTAVRRLHKDLTGHIEMLPVSGEVVCSLDKEMLLLKATSTATVACLEQCLAILQRQASTIHRDTNGIASCHQLNSSTSNYTSNSKEDSSQCFSASPVRHNTLSTTTTITAAPMADVETPASCALINRLDEVVDSSVYVDTDLDGMDEHKTVILHLLSQLKLGMDLTKVVLPTFILEKRSLLEMFADCMAHPELFLRISDEQTAERRMLAVVEWYLTSFHAGRQGSVAKKPYNPIIGECFHCSWSVPTASTTVRNGQPSCAPNGDTPSSHKYANQPVHLYYCAEQVSHHPPVSAFYFESPEKQMYMDASIWTRSKFMGMSIGVALIGKVRLRLLAPGGTTSAAESEEYEFSLPSVYARSILTVPWVELGDKVSVHCEQTGYSAAIIFHTKPFYGGRLHKVTGEIKNSAGETVSRVAGEWNATLEFTQTNTGLTRTVDTCKLAVNHKHVRPIDVQDPMESRRLWRHVTENLHSNDIDKATEHKRILEDAQRESERLRKESRLPYPTKYFHPVDDEWVFKCPLQAGQSLPSV